MASSLGFPGGSVVKDLPAKQETRIQLLGQENPLEKEMATHPRILAREIPWREERQAPVPRVTKSQTRLSH